MPRRVVNGLSPRLLHRRISTAQQAGAPQPEPEAPVGTHTLEPLGLGQSPAWPARRQSLASDTGGEQRTDSEDSDAAPFSRAGVAPDRPSGPSAVNDQRGVGLNGVDLAATKPSLHLPTCSCPGCNARSDHDLRARTATSTTNKTPTRNLATTSLQNLATYLTTDYWREAKTFSRRYNLSSTGIGAKGGSLSFNITGWSADRDGLSAERQSLVREAFKLYSACLGINFTEVFGTGGDIRFSDNQSGAYAYAATGWYNTPARNSVTVDYSVINVATTWYGGRSTYNSYTPQTFLHEIGHALGLGHQGLYNYTGTSLTFATSAQLANDSWQGSMMSYWSQTDNPNTGATFAWLQTPMTVDWIALNNLYADQGFGTSKAFMGDTIYGVNTNISASTSSIWNQFSTLINSSAYTLVDNDGFDSLDVSNFSCDQLINLAPSQADSSKPSSSNIGGGIGNLTMAIGTVIEAAKGGSGADQFHGNTANNHFQGGGGDDRFHDSAGSDSYIGDAGSDWVSFDESFQTFQISGLGDRLLLSRQFNCTDVDTIWDSVERITFQGASYTYSQLLEISRSKIRTTVQIHAANGGLSSGAATNSTNIQLQGSSNEPLQPGQYIAIFRDGTSIGTAVPIAGSGSHWSFTLQEHQGVNTVSYSAQVLDAAGEAGLPSEPFLLRIDTVAPRISVHPLTTPDTTPLLSGSIDDPAAEVSISIGATSRKATTNSRGEWSLQWDDALRYGQTYNIIASARDAAGNSSSDTSNAELTIDSTGPILYFSLATAIGTAAAATLGGLTAQTNDIIAFDGEQFSIWLDGDSAGLQGASLRDIQILSADEAVVAFSEPVTLAGINFDDSDLARLTRTANGTSVALFFDGSDVGLSTSREAIDAITGLADGSWLISTRGGGSIDAVGSFAEEDLLRFLPVSLGSTTSGTWSLHADLSDVGLSGGNENISAVDAAADGRLFLSSAGLASAPALSAGNEDVFVFRPTSLGNTTKGSFEPSLFFDGSAYGLVDNALVGLDVVV